MRFTIYVFDATVVEFDQVLAVGKLNGPNAFEPVEVENVQFEASGYLQRNRVTTPPWLTIDALKEKLQRELFTRNGADIGLFTPRNR
jgi:hypothetical protein